jgi:hypothetical protein
MKAMIINLFSKAAAAAILNVKPEEIKKVEAWAKVVNVSMKHSRNRFVPIAEFKRNFVKTRREGAEGLIVETCPMIGGFMVKNPERDSNYMVVPNRETIICNCPDYQKQIGSNLENFGTTHGCCKHIYAVLNHLGYGRLSDYINSPSALSA